MYHWRSRHGEISKFIFVSFDSYVLFTNNKHCPLIVYRVCCRLLCTGIFAVCLPFLWSEMIICDICVQCKNCLYAFASRYNFCSVSLNCTMNIFVCSSRKI